MIEFLAKYKELIVILSGIGTFISALIALFTLTEVKKQRLSLYKPEILLKSFIVRINKSPFLIKEGEMLQYKASDYNDYSDNSNDKNFRVNANYKVNNLGFGIAKDIKCQWKFDTKKALKMIKELLPKNYTTMNLKDLNLFIINDINDDQFQLSINYELDKQEIDYVSPINIQDHNHLHSIPKSIILSHYLYLLLKKKLTGKEGENFHITEFDKTNFPVPYIKIDYRDLNNKFYKKEFGFKMSMVVTQINEVLDLDDEFAYLTFEIK